MSNEEVERAIEFLIKSQAQLTANVDNLTVTVNKLSEKVDRTADSVFALLTIAEIHEREINALKDASRATDEKMAESARAADEKLAESSRVTDERLNALILMVERYISRRDGNGDAQPEEK
jgi:FtsZ-binding cell division protein ZapB